MQGVMLRLLRVVDARMEKAQQRDAKKAARAAVKDQKAFEREAARCKQAGLPAPQKSKILKQCAPSSGSCHLRAVHLCDCIALCSHGALCYAEPSVSCMRRTPCFAPLDPHLKREWVGCATTQLSASVVAQEICSQSQYAVHIYFIFHL